MLKKLLTASSVLVLLSTLSIAKDELVSQKEKAAYVIGTKLGQQLLFSKDNIDLDSLKLGIKDVFEKNELKLTKEQMEEVIRVFQENKMKKQNEMLAKLAKEGKEFLAKNKKKKGVVTLKNGLQYKVITKGKGKVSPKPNDTVKTHYKGTLVNGTVFDSSYERGTPVSFPVNGVIPGWTQALQLMHEGDKWQLFIPSELAYGKRGAPPSIGPDATLVFDIELIEILKK